MQPQFIEPDQDWASSSSSPLRSISVGSPESTPLFYTMPTAGTSFWPTSTALLLPHQQQTTEANYNNLPIQNLNPEWDNAELTKAMLAVISSSPSSSASSQMSGAFKECTSALASSSQMKPSSGKQNMLKRSLSIMKMRDELTDDIPRTSSSQLHHKISERKRREKLNESFQELRSLLPPGSKKDKASVLLNALDYLSNLKIEVMDLKQKNEVLEARSSNGASEEAIGDSSDEKSVVQISSVPSESTSDEQEIELQVTVRGDCNIIDLILDILEYLKLVHEVTLLFMDADTKLIHTKVINRINFRLKTKKSEWDQAAFQEAINWIVTDLAN